MRDVPLLLVKSLKKLSSRACAIFARIFAFSFIFLFLYRGCGGKFLFLSFLFLFCGVSAYNNPVQKEFLYAETELLYAETILVYTETPFRYAKIPQIEFLHTETLPTVLAAQTAAVASASFPNTRSSTLRLAASIFAQFFLM